MPHDKHRRPSWSIISPHRAPIFMAIFAMLNLFQISVKELGLPAIWAAKPQPAFHGRPFVSFCLLYAAHRRLIEASVQNESEQTAAGQIEVLPQGAY